MDGRLRNHRTRLLLDCKLYKCVRMVNCDCWILPACGKHFCVCGLEQGFQAKFWIQEVRSLLRSRRTSGYGQYHRVEGCPPLDSKLAVSN